MARETFARHRQYIVFSWIVHLSREMMIFRVRSSVCDRSQDSSARSRAEMASLHRDSRIGVGMRERAQVLSSDLDFFRAVARVAAELADGEGEVEQY